MKRDFLLSSRPFAQACRPIFVATICSVALPAIAQQPAPASPPVAPPQQFQQSQEWAKLPKMVLGAPVRRTLAGHCHPAPSRPHRWHHLLRLSADLGGALAADPDRIRAI